MEHSGGKEHPQAIYGRELPKTLNEYLYLVHDEGVYLMSGATDRLWDTSAKRCIVAYARGLSPEDPECWESSRDAVGGDDFAEPIPLEAFEQTLAEDPDRVVVRWGKRTYSVTSGGRRRRNSG